MLAWVAQAGCGTSILGGTPKLSGHGPGQPAVGGLAWAGRWTSRPPEIPASFSCSVILQRFSVYVCALGSPVPFIPYKEQLFDRYINVCKYELACLERKCFNRAQSYGCLIEMEVFTYML